MQSDTLHVCLRSYDKFETVDCEIKVSLFQKSDHHIQGHLTSKDQFLISILISPIANLLLLLLFLAFAVSYDYQSLKASNSQVPVHEMESTRRLMWKKVVKHRERCNEIVRAKRERKFQMVIYLAMAMDCELDGDLETKEEWWKQMEMENSRLTNNFTSLKASCARMIQEAEIELEFEGKTARSTEVSKKSGVYLPASPLPASQKIRPQPIKNQSNPQPKLQTQPNLLIQTNPKPEERPKNGVQPKSTAINPQQQIEIDVTKVNVQQSTVDVQPKSTTISLQQPTKIDAEKSKNDVQQPTHTGLQTNLYSSQSTKVVDVEQPTVEVQPTLPPLGLPKAKTKISEQPKSTSGLQKVTIDRQESQLIMPPKINLQQESTTEPKLRRQPSKENAQQGLESSSPQKIHQQASNVQQQQSPNIGLQRLPQMKPPANFNPSQLAKRGVPMPNIGGVQQQQQPTNDNLQQPNIFAQRAKTVAQQPHQQPTASLFSMAGQQPNVSLPQHSQTSRQQIPSFSFGSKATLESPLSYSPQLSMIDPQQQTGSNVFLELKRQRETNVESEDWPFGKYASEIQTTLKKPKVKHDNEGHDDQSQVTSN